MKDFILISIRSHYWQKIIAGEKIFEFRKKIPNFNNSQYDKNIIIYSSGKDKAIVGVFKVQTIFSLPFAALMNKLNIVEVDRDGFKEYYQESKICHAIEIVECVTFKESISLSKLKAIDNSFFPPQNYRFITRQNAAIYKAIHLALYGECVFNHEST